MFCPCARSYLMVEGLQTERPRLVRSRLPQPQESSSRAPLPMQIRPQSGRGSLRRDEEAQAYTDGPVPEEPEVCYEPGSQVRSRPMYYHPRGYGQPRGIMKVPTEEFPFDYETPRQTRTIQRSKDVHVEVGRSSNRSPSPTPDPPASDVVKIRVCKRGGDTTPYCRGGIITEKVRFKKVEALRADDVESNRGWEF
ncbi:hypothetical protein BDV12DRAFT_188852 [Aspergillus spectabilis]